MLKKIIQFRSNWKLFLSQDLFRNYSVFGSLWKMLWSFILFILIIPREIPGKPILQRKDGHQIDRDFVDTSSFSKKYHGTPDRAVGE